MDVPVLTAVTGAREASLVQALDGVPGVVVVRRCADLSELLAAAAAGHGRAALVSADLRRLDRDALARLAAAGLAVVGVGDAAGAPGAGHAEQHLAALGVRHRVPADADGAQVAAAVLAAVTEVADAGSAGPAGAGGAAGAPARAPGLPSPRGAAADGDDHPADAVVGAPPGRLVAVWGPPGAPGRTAVATSLAAELAGLGQRVLLVDADTWAASAAQVLGLLDESAGVAAACRAAAVGALTPARLAELAPPALPGLAVLTGLPRADRWPELGAAALEELWAVCRLAVPWTVVDLAAPLDSDEELVLDTAAPRRNAAALTALAAADEVLVVGQADPVGLQRLVRGLAELAEAVPSAAPRVVVTRVRASSVGPRPAERVREALARYAGVAAPVLVPDDRAAHDAALLAGRTLAEVAPASPARAALAALAGELLAAAGGGPARARPRRWARMRG